jgi:hypothetical protein
MAMAKKQELMRVLHKSERKLLRQAVTTIEKNFKSV